MDVAEVLSIIVERACSYAPEAPVGKMFNDPKEERTKGLRFPKEALTDSEKGSPNEALPRVQKKVPVAASDLVSLIVRINLFKAVGLLICLV